MDTNESKLQVIKASQIVVRLNELVKKPGVPHVDWNELYVLFCDELPMFENSLRQLTALSDTEWKVCMLLKIGFPQSQIAILMNKSVEGISSIRRRLYIKVFQKKGKASDWDKFLETL